MWAETLLILDSSWVMLDGPHNIVPLPREKILFTSPLRTALTLQTPNPYPGKEPFSVKCSDGKAIITNQRVISASSSHTGLVADSATSLKLIYLPTTPTTILGLPATDPTQKAQPPSLKSFSAPLLGLQDTHVSAPFFGPNVWEAVLLPVEGGGIPSHHNLVQLKLTFKEGGAFDFSTIYERIKETISQAMDTARESGRPVSSFVDADLEQLPAYEEVGGSGAAPPLFTPRIQRPVPIAPNGTPRPAPPPNNGVVGLENGRSEPPPPMQLSNEPTPTPNEPPPGYEEVQRNSVADNLEVRAGN